MSDISQGPLEKIAAEIETNGAMLESLIHHVDAAAVLQEAGRLAETLPITEDHLRAAKQVYSQALNLVVST